MGGPLNAELVLGWSPVICLLRIKKMRPRRNNVSVPFRVWWKGGVFKQKKRRTQEGEGERGRQTTTTTKENGGCPIVAECHHPCPSRTKCRAWPFVVFLSLSLSLLFWFFFLFFLRAFARERESYVYVYVTPSMTYTRPGQRFLDRVVEVGGGRISSLYQPACLTFE